MQRPSTPAIGNDIATTRAEIASEFMWNLADLFASDDDWRSEKARLATELPQLGDFRGKLVSSPTVLADALETLYRLQKTYSRLRLYSQLLSDQDTRDARHQGMNREMIQLGAEFGSQASYLRPEILRMGAATIDEFLAAEPRLAIYRHVLADLTRRAHHILSEPEERILAAAAPLSGSPGSIHDVLTNADFPYPLVTLRDGWTVKVNQSTYEELRASPDRSERELVMTAFFEALGAFSNTLGTVMNGGVQKALFHTKARGFGSAVEAALFESNIPVTVYSRLIEGVNRHLSSLHRYLGLRKRILGVDRLHYYDIYAPLVESVTERYSPKQARDLITEAMSPLGMGYQAVVRRAFDERWMDWYPTPGKRSGAYNNGAAYDVHPYVLLNFNGSFTGVSTVAHELGHSLHSHYSNATQPYATAGYTIFLAEVASIFNEFLLLDHMIETTTDDRVRLSLLGDHLERLRSTLFRQVSFADFELQMHTMAQRGEPITGSVLSGTYLELVRRYYGHDSGVTVVGDYVAHEWSYVSHFYREFYVYQYATALTAAGALARKVKSGDTETTRRYLELLAAGGSDYPIELLRKTGVDMTTDEPLELTIRGMEGVMDEIERLL